MIMDAKLKIKLIIIATVCIIIMHEKIRGYLKAKLLFDISQSTYIKSIIGIALFTIVCVTCNSQDLNKYNNYDSEKERKNLIVNKAFIVAKAEVKLKLKSPSTAKFATEFDKESKYKINDDESVIIQSYVDAQNSFGAIIRTNFRCTVDKYGKVKDLKTW